MPNSVCTLVIAYTTQQALATAEVSIPGASCGATQGSFCSTACDARRRLSSRRLLTTGRRESPQP
jgi:hypothetical protein